MGVVFGAPLIAYGGVAARVLGAVIVAAGAACAWRGWRVGVNVDGDGLEVRNVLSVWRGRLGDVESFRLDTEVFLAPWVLCGTAVLKSGQRVRMTGIEGRTRAMARLALLKGRSVYRAGEFVEELNALLS